MDSAQRENRIGRADQAAYGSSMTSLKSLSAIALIGALAVVPAGAADDKPAEHPLATDHAPLTLVAEFTDGLTYVVTKEVSTRTETPMPEQVVISTHSERISAEITAAPGKDGTHRLATRYAHYAFSVDTMGNVMAFDSDHPDDASPILKHLQRMIARPFTMVVDADNKVIDLPEIDDVFSDIELGPVDETYREKWFGKNTVKALFSFGLPELPKDQPLANGDSWPIELESDAGGLGTIIHKAKYTLAGITTVDGVKFAVIRLTGEVTSTPEEGDINPTLVSEGSVLNGTLLWDLKHNFPHSFEMHQDLRLFKYNSSGEVVMVAPITTDQKITVEIK